MSEASLKQQVTEKQARIAELEMRVSGDDRELASLKANNDNIKASMEEMHKKLNEKDTEIENLESNIKQTNNHMKQLEKETASLKVVKEKTETLADNCVKNLENEAALLKRVKEQAEAHKNTAEERYLASGLETTSKNLQTDLTTQTNLVQTLQIQIQNRANHMDELQTDITNKDNLIQTLEATVTDNSGRLETLESTVTHKNAQILASETQIANKTQQIGQLESELEDNKKEIQNLEAKTTGQKHQIQALKFSLQSERQKTTEELAQAMAEKESSDQHNKQLNQDMEKLKAQHESFRAKTDQILSNSNAELATRAALIKQLETEVKSLKASKASSSYSSMPGASSSRPGVSSSTPGASSSTPGASSSTLGASSSKPRASSSTSTAQASTSASQSTTNWFGAVRHTLCGAQVATELERLKQSSKGRSYKLGAEIFPWGKNKPSRYTSTGHRAQKQTPASSESDTDGEDSGQDQRKGKGKKKANDEDSGQNQGKGKGKEKNAYIGEQLGSDESDSELSNEDDPVSNDEEDDHVVLRKFARKAIHRNYSHGAQTNNLSMSSFSILASHWNQALIHKLAAEAKLIVSKCADNRFHESVDFKAMIHERLAAILRTKIEARPRDTDETIEARILRLADHHQQARESSWKTNILHMKYHTRLSATTIMITASHQRGSEEDVETWQYVFRCLKKLQHHGMSDEEDGEEQTAINGRQEIVPVRWVLALPWRHESFRDLFAMLDETRQVESTIFSQQGRP
ncbi:hypothetical protein VKT23_016251 [Stygiomarasmius scandens]|uniref:Uncharacterized protein n=1 Tax=Marasmiellus scandens TaxID=2682957 RepID=A0ABR1J035_9AGAR